MSTEFEKKILEEVGYSMDAAQFGEDTTCFAGVIITKKNKQLIPTFLFMTKHKLKDGGADIQSGFEKLLQSISKSLNSPIITEGKTKIQIDHTYRYTSDVIDAIKEGEE